MAQTLLWPPRSMNCPFSCPTSPSYCGSVGLARSCTLLRAVGWVGVEWHCSATTKKSYRYDIDIYVCISIYY